MNKRVNRQIKGQNSEGQDQSLNQFTVSQQYKSSMLPEPADMLQYEKILPGSTERLLRMVEKEQDHRHSLQKKELNWSMFSGSLGQIFAVCLVGISLFITYKTGSKITFNIILVLLVSVFFTGRYIKGKP